MANGTINIAVVLWLGALGAAIGSFLNVVIYRLPAGLSLIRPASHCPSCKHPIRWYDNVPVFGWIALRGRCRDCGAGISPRYPIVEAITALVFLLVALAEAISGGANLPLRPVRVADGWIYPALGPGEVAGIVAWHLLLLTTLLAAAGIEYDGRRPPWKLYWPALAIGLLAPLAWPYLHPVPVWHGVADRAIPSTGPLAGFLDSLAGLGGGAVMGFLAGWAAPPGTRAGLDPRHRWIPALTPAAACVGLYLGWQAIAVLAAGAWAFWLLGSTIGPWRPAGRIPAIAWLALLTLAWILLWRPIVGRWPMFG